MFSTSAIKIVTALVVVASFGLSAGAAPIHSISGIYAFGPANNATGSTVPFTGGLMTQTSTPPTPYPFGGPGSYSVSNVTLNLATFTSNPGPISITSPIVITEFGTGNTAVFNVMGAGSLNALPESGAVDFGFAVQLASNTTALFNVSDINSVWQLLFSYQGLRITSGGAGGSFSVVQASPGVGTSSASFTLNRADLLLGGLPVPEPASILAWGAVAGFSWLVGRRKLRASRR